MVVRTTDGDDEAMKEKTPLVIGGTIGVALVAIVLVMGLGREIQSFDTATPEGVVQQYVQAMIDRDLDSAELHRSSQFADCEFERDLDGYLHDARVILGVVDIDGEGATVEVKTTQYNETGLDGGEWDSTFTLTLVGETWLIETATWPYGCD